ncbi:MAG TPA: hypothetical protein VNT79_15595 [Phycisphaerae bacterium]|nr:hypothetical protein [Phycisphaerae bacterium]
MIAQFTGPTPAQWLIILALALFVVLVLSISQRNRRRAGSPRQYGREIDGATRRSEAVKKDLESLLVEINELTRSISGQFDERLVKLESLIARADQRIDALRNLAQPTITGGRVAVSAERVKVDDSATASISSPVGRGRAMDILVDDAADYTGHIASENLSATRLTQPSIPGHDAPVARLRGLENHPHQDVYALADQGRTPLEIAQSLSRAVGEVELILHLRRRTTTSTAPLS